MLKSHAHKQKAVTNVQKRLDSTTVRPIASCCSCVLCANASRQVTPLLPQCFCFVAQGLCVLCY